MTQPQTLSKREFSKLARMKAFPTKINSPAGAKEGNKKITSLAKQNVMLQSTFKIPNQK